MAVVFYVLAVLFALYCIGVIASKAAGTKFFLVWIAAAILCAGTGVLLQKGLWERLPQPVKATAIGVIASKAAGTKFFLVWIAAAILCAGTGVLLQKGLWERLPQPVKATALAVLGAGIACFVAVECFIVSGFFAEGSGNLPYIVVLGAQMKENGPSVALAKRLDRAYEYLQENPDTLCVLSAWRWQSGWTGHTSIFRKIRTLSACFQEGRAKTSRSVRRKECMPILWKRALEPTG